MPRVVKLSAALSLPILLITFMLSAPASASSVAPTQPAPSSATRPSTTGLPSAARNSVLGNGWQNSGDSVWSLSSSDTGLKVLTAPVSNGVSWRQLNSLSVPGVDSRQWIGQGCLLVKSHTLAVAFGPIEYLDVAAAFAQGGYAALVNLDTGAVTTLPIRPTFSYFSPTCGAAGTATFTSFAADETKTSINVVSANGKLSSPGQNIAGELIGATSNSTGGTTAILGDSIVSVSAGRTAPVVTAPATPYDLHTTADGAVTYLVDSGSGTSAHRYLRGKDAVVANANTGDLAVDSTASGALIVHGGSARAAAAVANVRVAQAAHNATASLNGSAFVKLAGLPGVGSGVTATVSSASGAAASEVIPATVFTTTASASGFSTSATSATTTSLTTDSTLPCAVKRNDVNTEAYQPSVAQVEYAVDEAIGGKLTTTRAANYRGFGLPSYTAQKLFPLTPLKGGGSVPPQIMLGILANESNLWQASSHVSPGGYGNPLTGNIYGQTYDSNGNPSLTIDFSQADCGYGVAQVTDGMRTGQMSATSQRAVALDYQTNIADGLDILIAKWNQLASYSPPIQMNNGDPQSIENWYAAAWAYNSGLQPNSLNGNQDGCTPAPNCTDSAGNWGLGWANNPANPAYQPNRHMFNSDPSDATKPGNWPYQERVIGWAAYPIYEAGGSYAQAWWPTDAARANAIPSPSLFCTAANHCGSGDCQYNPADTDPLAYHCWTHYAVTWAACASGNCGHSQTTYGASSAEPKDPTTQDPADCNTTSLASNAVIVDDVASSAPSPAAPCHSVPSAGAFAFTFTADSNGNYPAHIDLHQINGGLNGHYWFTHSVQTNNLTTAIGTWSFPSTTTGSGQVLVHVPALGAQTLQAHYTITDGATGKSQTRILNQDWGTNHWLSLGAAQFTANEKVSLSSYAPNDTSSDLAWDAVAFVPTGKPTYTVVGLGDSYSSGEGLEPYITNTDNSADACHRSSQAYVNLITLPKQTVALGKNSTDSLDFLACSGAHSTSLTAAAVNTSTSQENPFDTKWSAPYFDQGEELQIPAGYLDANTDAVTLSIGGNDARFADVIKACTATGSDPLGGNCSDPGYRMASDSSSLATLEPHIITDLLPAKLKATYLAIHQAAPNAVIFVVGYPALFPPTKQAQYNECPALQFITDTDMTWINSMSVLMTKTINGAVTAVAAQGVKIHFVDPTAAFAGHDVCASSSWINGIISYSDSGSGFSAPGTGSFHPKAAGQAAYASLVTTAMALICLCIAAAILRLRYWAAVGLVALFGQAIALILLRSLSGQLGWRGDSDLLIFPTTAIVVMALTGLLAPAKKPRDTSY